MSAPSVKPNMYFVSISWKGPDAKIGNSGEADGSCSARTAMMLTNMSAAPALNTRTARAKVAVEWA